MRISDWSSDVCSSDLELADVLAQLARAVEDRGVPQLCGAVLGTVGHGLEDADGHAELRGDPCVRVRLHVHHACAQQIGRASCRERVCRTCRSRWSPYHYTKNHKYKS